MLIISQYVNNRANPNKLNQVHLKFIFCKTLQPICLFNNAMIPMQGILPNGNTIAVKQLFIKNEQGLVEFCNEVVLITGMRHRNLVKLKGCCLHETQRFLVYEYVENYDLQQALLGNVSSSCIIFIKFI